jgi:hypothetical protein
VHNGHLSSPAIKFKSLCIIDGDSEQNEDEENGIIRLPGEMPESTIFNHVAMNIDKLAPLLTVACHQDISQQSYVVETVHRLHAANRDAHLIYSQLGLELGWVPEQVVVNAFFSLWILDHPEETDKIANKVLALLPADVSVPE